MTADNRTNEPSHNRITIQAFRDGEVSIIHEDLVRAIACTLDELKRAVATYEARGALEAAGRHAGTFTEAQVEAVAKAIYSVQRPGWAWHENQQPRWHRKLARAALVAAQGAAPQAESEELAWYKRAAKHSADSMAEARATLQMFADRVDPFVFDELSSVLDDQPLDYETGDVIGEPAPVLPSNGVDEDKLAEVIGKARTTSIRDEDGVKSVVMESNEQIARAVAEWLKGQGR